MGPTQLPYLHLKTQHVGQGESHPEVCYLQHGENLEGWTFHQAYTQSLAGWHSDVRIYNNVVKVQQEHIYTYGLNRLISTTDWLTELSDIGIG